MLSLRAGRRANTDDEYKRSGLRIREEVLVLRHWEGGMSYGTGLLAPTTGAYTNTVGVLLSGSLCGFGHLEGGSAT